jgi:transposase InsO family protein
VHVCVDDFSRLAYVEVLSDERATTAIGFLRRALEWFAAQGVRVERVLTDNGSAYRSHAHALACRALGLRHSRTKPRRTHERQSRTLHPDATRRLGLRAHLRQQRRTRTRAPHLV